MQLPRMTTRSWMVVVAVVAFMTAGIRWDGFRALFLGGPHTNGIARDMDGEKETAVGCRRTGRRGASVAHHCPGIARGNNVIRLRSIQPRRDFGDVHQSIARPNVADPIPRVNCVEQRFNLIWRDLETPPAARFCQPCADTNHAPGARSGCSPAFPP